MVGVFDIHYFSTNQNRHHSQKKMSSNVLLLNKSFGSDLFSECADRVISHSAQMFDSSSELRRILIKTDLLFGLLHTKLS